MKKHISILFFLLLIASCTQEPKFEIYGEIENYEGYVFLRTNDFIDSTEVEDGKFYFEGKVNRVLEAALVNKQNGIASGAFYLDNDSIYVKTQFSEPYILLTEIYSPANELPEIVMEDLGAIMSDEEKIRSNAMFLYMDSITQIHPKNDFILEIISEVITSDFITIQQANKLLGQIDTTLMDPSYFASLKTALDRQVRINPGDQFPNFAFEGFNGEIYNKESFPNKYLLIDVWATWCGPCIQAFEKLKPIYSDLDGQLEILGVSIDPTQERAENFLNKNDLPWKHAWAEREFDNEFMKQLGVVFLPFYYLISPEGKILAINPAIDDIEELIKNRSSLKEVMR